MITHPLPQKTITQKHLSHFFFKPPTQATGSFHSLAHVNGHVQAELLGSNWFCVQLWTLPPEIFIKKPLPTFTFTSNMGDSEDGKMGRWEGSPCASLLKIFRGMVWRARNEISMAIVATGLRSGTKGGTAQPRT